MGEKCRSIQTSPSNKDTGRMMVIFLADSELKTLLALSLPGIYPKELKSESQRDISTPVFTEILFVIANM